MDFKLMVDDKNSIELETNIGLGYLPKKDSEFSKVWKKVKNIEGFELYRDTTQHNKYHKFNGEIKKIICNDKIAMIWNTSNELESIKLDLNSLNDTDKKYDSFYMRHWTRKYGFKFGQLEEINIYDFIMNLLISGNVNKKECIRLEDFRKQWCGVFMSINSDNILIITKNYYSCSNHVFYSSYIL